MDELKRARQRYFDELAGCWDSMPSPEQEKRLRALVRELPLSSGQLVLDVGCGTGRLTRVLLQEIPHLGRVVGVDISLRMVASGRAKIRARNTSFLQADAEHLPFRDGAFDLIACFATFPHIDDKGLALAEFRRTLRPDSHLFIFHLMGRDKVNSFHGRLGAPVSGDLLPDEDEMRRLAAANGFRWLGLTDREDLYLLHLRRPLA